MSQIYYESLLTCPVCEHQQIEKFSEIDCCHFKYKCHGCGNVMEPKSDGTCVLCNYGTVKCPATQKSGSDRCECCKDKLI